MSFNKRIPTAAGWLVAALAVFHGVGCGGSAYTAGSGGTSSGAAGTGSTGAGGNSGSKGSGTAGSGSAGLGGSSGSTGSGAAAGTGEAGSGHVCNVLCPTLNCGPGTVAVREPGACCATCVSDGSGGSGGQNTCGGVTCPAFACVQGYKLEQKAGECCPSCVADPCLQGQQSYESLKQKLLQPASATNCKVDTDCAALANNAKCGDVCTSPPVNTTSKPSIDQQLSSFAQDKCSSCMPIYPPCAAPPPVICSAGQCVNGGYS